MAKKYVYAFAEGNANMRDLLGGKGANLAEMTGLGLPVPPGLHDYDRGVQRLHAPAAGDAGRAVGAGRSSTWRRSSRRRASSSATRRTRCSSRCAPGAKFSMPGMMDTVLNLGLNDETVQGWPTRPATSASPRTATAASSRCSATSCWARSRPVRAHLRATQASRPGAKHDHDLPAETLQQIVARLQGVRKGSRRARTFPQDPLEQLRLAIEAVFDSWNEPRAPSFTASMNGIPDDLGTAVNVAAMVFGNIGDDSGTGVVFTRNPTTGAQRALRRVPDQRAGRGRRRRHPHAAADRGSWQREVPDVYRQLQEIGDAAREALPATCRTSSSRSSAGRLYMLQTRAGKRTAQAAIKIAVDLVAEGLIDRSDGAAARRAGRSSISCCTAASTRQRDQARRAGQRPAGLAGRGDRPGRLRRRPRRATGRATGGR